MDNRSRMAQVGHAHSELQTKAALRQTFRARRAAAVQALREAGIEPEGPMARWLSQAGRIKHDAVVALYRPMADELDPLRLVASVRQPLALPCVFAKAAPLLFRRWSPGAPLRRGVWNIEEPEPTAAAVEPDVLLVPLLAVDAQGFRLGYGGGYYDRTLSGLRRRKPIFAIGLALDIQRVDVLPRSDYDEPVDAILTPSGLFAAQS
ncbi:MAG: 5-formyltetrahydrofolate cyclo-ligase [Hyphomicrobiaceae bacterium]